MAVAETAPLATRRRLTVATAATVVRAVTQQLEVQEILRALTFAQRLTVDKAVLAALAALPARAAAMELAVMEEQVARPIQRQRLRAQTPR